MKKAYYLLLFAKFQCFSPKLPPHKTNIFIEASRIFIIFALKIIAANVITNMLNLEGY